MLRRRYDKFVLWFNSVLFCWALVVVQSVWRRRKMSHNNGIAGAGRLRITPDPRIPENDFFVAGREFDCRVRHATASMMDDGMLTVKSGSLKFADAAGASPLDLTMNTGRSLFWSARNFLEFARNQHERGGVQYVSFYRKFPAGRDAAQDSVVRFPSSYAHLDYRSQCPFAFHARDGKPRYVNFRLVPADQPPEPLNNSIDQIGVFFGDQRIDPREPRTRNWLKEEYAARVARGPVRYRLQLQLHEAGPADTELVFCSNKEWDEATHPWLDVAEVTIDRVLGYEEGLKTWFSLNHMPPAVTVLPAKSMDDYNSLNYIRARSDLAKKARLLMYRLFGVPKELPAIGPRNVTEVTCEK